MHITSTVKTDYRALWVSPSLLSESLIPFDAEKSRENTRLLTLATSGLMFAKQKDTPWFWLCEITPTNLFAMYHAWEETCVPLLESLSVGHSCQQSVNVLDLPLSLPFGSPALRVNNASCLFLPFLFLKTFFHQRQLAGYIVQEFLKFRGNNCSRRQLRIVRIGPVPKVS